MRERPICCDGAEARGASVIASSCNSAFAISSLPSHLSFQSLPPTPRVKNSLCACKIPSFGRLRRHWSLLEQVELRWRREWSSSASHFLCLSRSPLSLLPDLLPQSDGPNVRVHPREQASERRKIVKINELFFPWPSDRPTARVAPALSPGPFLASCGRVDSKRRKDGESSAGERGRGKTVLPFCRRCAR